MKLFAKNIKIIFLKSKLALMEYFEYRSSLLFYTLSAVIWSLGAIFVQKFLFDEIHVLKGWTFGEIVLLNAIYNYAFSFFIMFTWTAIWSEFKDAVKSGGLDMILTKPFSHKLMVTFGYFDITGFLHLLPSTAILFYALNFSFLNIIFCLIYFIIGQFALNSLVFVIYSSTFWLTSAEHIGPAFWSIEGQSKTPLEILPRSLKVLLLTLIPIGFVAYIPTRALMGKLSPWFLAYTVIFVIILELINRTVWKAGLRRYESVSS
jgi:ABC-2 type transport system permease protein